MLAQLPTIHRLGTACPRHTKCFREYKCTETSALTFLVTMSSATAQPRQALCSLHHRQPFGRRTGPDLHRTGGKLRDSSASTIPAGKTIHHIQRFPKNFAIGHVCHKGNVFSQKRHLSKLSKWALMGDAISIDPFSRGHHMNPQRKPGSTVGGQKK